MDADTFNRLSDAEKVNYLNSENAEATGQPYAPAREPGAGLRLLPWIGGALFVVVVFVLLTVGSKAPEKDCSWVPAAGGQLERVCS